MARPSTGVVGHGQAPHRDDRLLLSSPTKGRPTATKSPYKGATGCCQGQQPPAGTTTCSAAPVSSVKSLPSLQDDFDSVEMLLTARPSLTMSSGHRRHLYVVSKNSIT
ncbi:hypothetical protein BHM03_00036269 [Ensete ventricosum]|nr:hypothetical protein BHM03_00036269 [Ensete ventricosum]